MDGTMTCTDGILTFNNMFNRKIDSITIPDNIHTIKFGHDFNQKLDNVVFPHNLHTIYFGDRFNQSIYNVKFPDSLHTIRLGLNFDQKFENVKFPDSLRVIRFDCKHAASFNHKSISNLHTVEIGSNSMSRIGDFVFPDNLHTIVFCLYSAVVRMMKTYIFENIQIPANLHTIRFEYVFDQDIVGLENTNVHTLDFSGVNVYNIANKTIPITIKEVIVNVKHSGLLKLPYGCFETLRYL